MQRFIGFDDSAMIYNRQYEISAEAPCLTTIFDAFLSRVHPSSEGNYLEDLAGGVFTADGLFVDASAQPRSDGHNAILRGQGPVSATSRDFIPRAVFAGVAFDHFGHFLLETTARLWTLPEYGDWPWIFLTAGRTELPRYQMGFLNLLGLQPEQVIAVSESCIIGELVIPDPAFIYHHRATHAYRDIFRRARLDQTARKSRKIFLSRSNMTIALTVGEQELEDTLARDGWEIIYPENLPPLEQAHLFHDDNIVMGLQGSAMHLGLFGQDGRRVVHLCRGQGYRGYYILDDLVHAHATYFQAMQEPDLKSRPITGPFLLNLDNTCAFLKAEGLLGASSIAMTAPSGGAPNARLVRNYEAWWHFTESQIRLHRQIDNAGRQVPSQAAIEPAIAAATLWPENAELVAHAAALALKFDGPAAAEMMLQRFRADLATSTDKADTGLMHLLSTVQDGQGRYEEAFASATRAYRLAPDNTIYGNQLAIALLRLERWADVRQILDGIIAAKRDNAVTHSLLSLIHEEAAEDAAALAAMREAVRLDPHDSGLCQRLVRMLRARGQDAAARDHLAGHLEGHWSNAGLLVEMADIEQTLGNHASSYGYLQRAFHLVPRDEDIRARYVRMSIAQGLLPDLIRRGMQPDSATVQKSVMIYRHSQAMAESGRLDQAASLAVKAAELCPDNIVIMNSLLGIMMKTGRVEDARLLIGLVMAGREAAGETYYVLSLIEGKRGDQQAALDAAREASLREPGNEVITEHYRRMCEAA